MKRIFKIKNGVETKTFFIDNFMLESKRKLKPKKKKDMSAQNLIDLL